MRLDVLQEFAEQHLLYPHMIPRWDYRHGHSLEDHKLGFNEREKQPPYKGKLTTEQVLAIRASTDSHGKLAKQYGVHRTVILRVKKGERYKHVQGG